MTLQLRKAERKKAKLRVGLSGPSGSGKTYSALLIAKGITGGNMEKVAIIDTENGSADLYANLGDYNVIRLENPYSPERYIEAIKTCEDAGMDVIVIDSVTHEWDGKGGCLESNELLGQTKFKGNNWAAWSVTTPRHQRFIETITGSRCHIITTARSKTDTIQTEDKKIKKVGLKEIQREGYEYELTLNFNVDRDGHYATASKDRTNIFDKVDPFLINEETGKTLIEWANSGAGPSREDIAKEQKREIVGLLKDVDPEFNTKNATAADYTYKVKNICNIDLIEANYEAIILRLRVIIAEQKKATDDTLAEMEAKEPGEITYEPVNPEAPVTTSPPAPQPAPVAPLEAKKDPIANALGLDPKDIPAEEEKSNARKLMEQGIVGAVTPDAK